MIHLYHPEPWSDYELIDCGGYEKLERFGKFILIRPEPQAVWNKKLNESDWTHLHHIRFKGRSATSGEWIKKSENIPDRWNVRYERNGLDLTLRLGLTSFKHLGIFPEQAVNWDYIYKTLKSFKSSSISSGKPLSSQGFPEEKRSGGMENGLLRFLNLFAYTGAASLAAKAAGADVTHLDSIKQVLNWASDNQELSGLRDIRWVLEDALKFVKREVKRGKLYHGIILDPPAYGNGPNGEKWKLEDQIQEIVSEVVQLLEPQKHFLILNTYSLGFSSLIVENLLSNSYKLGGKIEVGELFLKSTSSVNLPLGVLGKIESR
jgi:23S rRNA (cytosine1962-C5)-methyltransferase